MTEIPLPGRPVRGSKSGSPIMAMFDLLGRPWAMGVLWVLAEHGPGTFRQLQARCETISPGMLNSRIKDLRAADFIKKSENGYEVTEMGHSVYLALLPLSHVSKHWAKKLANSQKT